MPAKIATFFVVLTFVSPAFGDDSQFHVRGGPFYSTFWGPESGTISIPGAIDLEYERFLSNQSSLVFRYMTAMEFDNSRVYYQYGGSGMRFYFASKGMETDAKEATVSISAIPRWRFYYGFDLGVGTALVHTFGTILQIMSTVADLGVCAGTIYQLNKRWGAEVHLGLTTIQGFSNVSVIGFTERGYLGVVYSF